MVAEVLRRNVEIDVRSALPAISRADARGAPRPAIPMVPVRARAVPRGPHPRRPVRRAARRLAHERLGRAATTTLLDVVEEFLTGAAPRARRRDRPRARDGAVHRHRRTRREQAGRARRSEVARAARPLPSRSAPRARAITAGARSTRAATTSSRRSTGRRRADRVCAMRSRPAARPLGLEVRAGLHTGEVELQGDDVAGHRGAHRGPGVRARRAPDEVLVTSTVRDLVVGLRASSSRTGAATSSRACPASGRCWRCKSDAMTSTGGGDVHDWGPLVGDLAKRRRAGARAWAAPTVRRAPALARQAHRARAARPAARSRLVGRVRHARRPHGRRARRPLPRGRRRGHRHRRDRRPAGRGRGVRLHGDGRLDGRRRREQDPRGCAHHAVSQRIPLVWLLDSAGARIQSTRARRSRARAPVPRAGRDERRRADGRGDARPLRGRHRVHPRARRLRPDGEGHVVDGARRPPPREGGGGRGRHRGGDGRLGGAHEDLGLSPTSRWPTTPSACAIVREYLSLLPAAQRGAAAGPRDRPIPSTGGSRSSTTSCRPRRGARTTCARSSTAIVDDGDVLLDEAGVGEEPRDRRSPGSTASRSASSRTSRWCSAARST